MARIVIDGRWIQYTGIGRYVENLITEAVRLAPQHQFIVLVQQGKSNILNLPKGAVDYVETDIVWYTPQEQLALPKLLDSLEPDLVHFMNFNVPLRYHKPFAVTIHDLTLLRFKNIRGGLLAPFTYRLKDVVMRHVLKTAVKRSRVIFTPSAFVKNDVAKRYRVAPEKILVTYNAADTPMPKPGGLKKFNLENKKFLLHVGNVYPHKNLDRLVQAFGELCKAPEFDYQLVIAGRKDEFHTRLEKVVRKKKLSDRVVFTDYVTDAELEALYAKASLYVFPSLSEGGGIPGLEAMRRGLPVVSSNATCLPETYGDAAEFFDPRSVLEMVNAIKRVLSDDKLRARLIKAGYVQAKKYSWKASAKQMLKGYAGALQKPTKH